MLLYCFKGRRYCNSICKLSGRWLTYFERADDPTAQSVTVDNPSTGVTATFVAEQDGTYKIYGKTGKPSYYRIVRQDAKYCDTTINVATPAGFPTVLLLY